MQVQRLTLLKASANYEKIAAGLSRALLEITEAVAVCAKECALYTTKALIGGIATLYAHIFCFLRNAIEWYTKRSSSRLLASFKEDFYEKFEDQVATIKQISASINREAQHASNSELRYLRLRLAKFEQSVGMGLQGWEREAAERIQREERVVEELRKIRMLHADQPRLLGAFKALLQGQASAFLLDRNTQNNGEHQDYLYEEHVCANLCGKLEAMQGRKTVEDAAPSVAPDNSKLPSIQLI